MIYKLKRYSKSTIPMRKPDIKFKNNKQEKEKQEYNNLKEPEEGEVVYEPQENSEDYYINNNDDNYSQQINL